MSAKTKIVVLHMKELIYTGIFAVLGILFVVLLVMMFLPDKEDSSQPDAPTGTESPGGSDTPDDASPVSDAASLYIPGVYSTELVLGDQTMNVEVMVDLDTITSIQLVNLSDAVTTMYPLLQPAFDSLTAQICEQQSLENLKYDTDSKYTSLVLLEAIRNSLEKAQP